MGIPTILKCAIKAAIPKMRNGVPLKRSGLMITRPVYSCVTGDLVAVFISMVHYIKRFISMIALIAVI
jgi:hypothetical protein